MSITDRTEALGEDKISRLLWQYAWPAVISQVIASVYNIVDRVFLGQSVGALAIAGLAITMPIMNVIHAFGSLVGAGSSARMSIVLGFKDVKWAEKILGNSMLLTFIFGFLFVTAGYVFMDDILTMFGASSDTISYAREYVSIILPGMFLTTLTFNLSALMRSSGYPTKSMLILAGGAVLNILLDALMIFGLDMGIAGAAWATTISMAISALAAILHFASPKSFIRFRAHSWTPKLYIFRNIIMIGLSPFLMNLAGSAVVALLNKQLIRYGGDLAVGAFGISESYIMLVVLLILGLCQGMQPIAGYNYGAGKTKRLKGVYLLTMKVGVILGIIGAAMAIVFPCYITRAFTKEEEMISVCIVALRFLSAMLPLIAFTIVNSNFFQSIDKPIIAIITSLSRQVLLLIPAMFIVPCLFVRTGRDGLTGVWLANTICDVLGAVMAATLLYFNRRVFKDKNIQTKL